MRLVKSIGLIVGTLGVFAVVGVFAVIQVWVAMFALFVVSRLSKKVIVFAEWSWPRFLVTMGLALGLPYSSLLLSAGF